MVLDTFVKKIILLFLVPLLKSPSPIATLTSNTQNADSQLTRSVSYINTKDTRWPDIGYSYRVGKRNFSVDDSISCSKVLGQAVAKEYYTYINNAKFFSAYIIELVRERRNDTTCPPVDIFYTTTLHKYLKEVGGNSTKFFLIIFASP